MTPTQMSPADLDAVKKFAAGDSSLRDRVHALYLQYVETELESLPIRFLSETFNPVPDYILKSIYRKKLLDL